MRYLIFLLIFLICLFTCLFGSIAHSQVHTYERTTAEYIDLQWSDPEKSYCQEQEELYPNRPCEMDWRFEIGGILEETGGQYHIKLLDINTNRHRFKMGIVGTVTLRVRACDMGRDPIQCSNWGVSSNFEYALVDGFAMGWVVHNVKAPVTDVIISNFLGEKYGLYQTKNNKMDLTGRRYHYGDKDILRSPRRTFQPRSV